MHILVIRMSAMGDVALTLPAVRGLLDENPELKITVLTRGFFSPFFANINRLSVYTPDLYGAHKGFSGLYKLYKELKQKHKFDLVVDLHAVIRSRVISSLFRLSGVKTYSIKKDRAVKKSFLGSDKEPDLPNTIDRYVSVFKMAGLSCTPKIPPVFKAGDIENLRIEEFLEKKNSKGKLLVGLAPFARHTLKIWPLEKVEGLLTKLQGHPEISVILFGGGKEETERLKVLSAKYNNCIIPNLKFSEELALMQKLSLMVSMDSSNMHLAALSGIPVVSVWGGTHPGIGFNAWNQPRENSIQIPKTELGCRPCTIYGKGECKRGDFACMNRITSDTVYQRVLEILSL